MYIYIYIYLTIYIYINNLYTYIKIYICNIHAPYIPMKCQRGQAKGLGTEALAPRAASLGECGRPDSTNR